MTLLPEALQALMHSDISHAVLDLREKGAYERAHIPGSVSVPRRLLAHRMQMLVTSPTTPIVLCDENGRLSALAEPALREMGFQSIRVLQGGLAAWRGAGKPLSQGINVPSKIFGERVLHERRPEQLTPHALQAEIKRGADLAIVDVRTPQEYRRGCIPGAVSVPGAELLLHIASIVQSPATTIVVHCGGRTRSYIGAESLRELGLPNRVVALENGTMGWQLAGFELERGAERRAGMPSITDRARAEQAARRAATAENVRFLTGHEAIRLWQSRSLRNVYLIDVRSAEEYEAGHAIGAIWAPGGQAVQAADDYFAVRSAAYVFMCDGVARAAITAAWFHRMGIKDVAVIDGGVQSWKAAGGAVESGAGLPAPFGFEKEAQAVPRISPRKFQRMLAGSDAPLVIGVDRSDLHARRHVPQALWACASRIEDIAARLDPGNSRCIVVTCADGISSTMAAGGLLRAGHNAVFVLGGGIDAWEADGLPTEIGMEHCADVVDDVVPKPYDRGPNAMLAYLRWEESLRPDGSSDHDLFNWESEKTRA